MFGILRFEAGVVPGWVSQDAATVVAAACNRWPDSSGDCGRAKAQHTATIHFISNFTELVVAVHGCTSCTTYMCGVEARFKG